MSEKSGLKPIHRRVIKLLENEKPCKMLDLPCGKGELSRHFQSRGFDVYSADVDQKALKFDDLKFIQADLNQKIEYEDGQFDMCLCIEGIEHTFNPDNVIKEISRVLKPGGTMMLSTPNVCRMKNRAHYFYVGIADISEPAPMPVEVPYNFMLHVSAVPLPQLDFFCRRHGLQITDIYCGKIRTTNRFLAALARPLLRYKLRKAYRNCRDKNASAVVSNLEKFMLSDEILVGEMLIIRAKKV